MGIYIKNWSLADWKELLKWAKIGANNAMIGEFSEVEEIPPHGRLIDADALMKQIEHDTPLSSVFEKTMRRYLYNAPTIIPAEEGER